MALENFLTVDLQSGTFFTAKYTYLLDTRRLSEQELDDFCEGTDSDRREIAERYGIDLETLPIF
jgi:hypothetical protein